MKGLLTHLARTNLAFRLALGTAAVSVYIVLLFAMGDVGRPPGRFPQLAEAFLNGRLSLVDPESGIKELIPADMDGAFYCPYPPLPAILLMPFVAVLGVAVKIEWACRVVSVCNVVLFDACLVRLPGLLRLGPLRLGPRIALNGLFAFGTATWHNSLMGMDWHFAHAVALGAMLLALWEFAGRNRPLLLGLFVAAAITARPTAGLACLFFVLPLFRKSQSCRRTAIARLAAFPLMAVLALALYNQARFGSPTDFGYGRMILDGEGRRMLDAFGQFHPRFAARNFFWYFLAPPWPLGDGRFPYVGFDPRGMSLFLASPALLYAFVGLRRGWRCVHVRHAAVGIACCLLPLLGYFNTGYYQFGHRFSMDYLPLVMVLVLAGMTARPGRLAYVLIAVSILAHVMVVLFDPAARLPLSLAPVLAGAS